MAQAAEDPCSTGAPRAARNRTRCGRGVSRPVEAVAIDEVDRADLTRCFGVFHSEKDARKALCDIARARHLCLKVLGFEDGAGSCFAYQMGKCKGACVGKEPLILHNTRLQLALSSLKLKAWPFPGRIALRERDGRGGAPGFARGTELHVLDHWTYLGTARTDEQLAEVCAGGVGQRSMSMSTGYCCGILPSTQSSIGSICAK